MNKPTLISTFFVIVLVPTCRSTVYTVGDAAGWDLSADLVSWGANKSFHVGDVLLFQYSSYHSVNEVNKEEYQSCNATRALLTSGSRGNTSIPLRTHGSKYFICGVFSHCLGGLKLQVNVEGDEAPVPAPAPPPPLKGSDSEAPPPPGQTSGEQNNPFVLPSLGFVHHAKGSVWVFLLLVVAVEVY